MLTQILENGVMTIDTPRHRPVLPSPVHSSPHSRHSRPGGRRGGAGRGGAQGRVAGSECVEDYTVLGTARVRDVMAGVTR